jgi:hypothetical protein
VATGTGLREQAPSAKKTNGNFLIAFRQRVWFRDLKLFLKPFLKVVFENILPSESRLFASTYKGKG